MTRMIGGSPAFIREIRGQEFCGLKIVAKRSEADRYRHARRGDSDGLGPFNVRSDLAPSNPSVGHVLGTPDDNTRNRTGIGKSAWLDDWESNMPGRSIAGSSSD
jgi:hypothetical protein